jgi:hypothetical protein
MLYLFDANVLITANNTYYPVSDVPEYWESPCASRDLRQHAASPPQPSGIIRGGLYRVDSMIPA